MFQSIHVLQSRDEEAEENGEDKEGISQAREYKMNGNEERGMNRLCLSFSEPLYEEDSVCMGSMVFASVIGM